MDYGTIGTVVTLVATALVMFWGFVIKVCRPSRRRFEHTQVINIHEPNERLEAALTAYRSTVAANRKKIDTETVHVGPRGGKYRLNRYGEKIYLPHDTPVSETEAAKAKPVKQKRPPGPELPTEHPHRRLLQ